jgi:hypothetical protein
LNRYILKQEYRNGRTFIKTEDAHFNISFSCISYLNSSLCLLPSNCTDQERAAIVLQGFHGLQLYANQFWYRHVLECYGLYAKRHINIPDGLSNQLRKLLRFRKQAQHEAPRPGDSSEGSTTLHGNDDSSAMSQLPLDVRNFIREVVEFRKRARNDDFAQKSLLGTLI